MENDKRDELCQENIYNLIKLLDCNNNCDKNIMIYLKNGLDMCEKEYSVVNDEIIYRTSHLINEKDGINKISDENIKKTMVNGIGRGLIKPFLIDNLSFTRKTRYYTYNFFGSMRRFLIDFMSPGNRYVTGHCVKNENK